MEDILEKVKKLLALGTSSNENEAALAVKRAHELLRQYNLSLSDVHLSEVDEHQIIESGRKSKKEDMLLLNLVCKQNYCRLIISNYYKGESKHCHTIIGLKHNVECSIEMYKYLDETVQRLTKAFMSRHNHTKRERKRVKKSYQLGIVSGLYKKLEQPGNNYWGEVPQGSLVFVKKAESVVQEYVEKKYPSLKQTKSRGSMVDSHAYNNGRADSNDISLSRQVKDNARLLEGAK